MSGLHTMELMELSEQKAKYAALKSKTAEQAAYDEAVAAFVNWLLGELKPKISWFSVPGLGWILTQVAVYLLTAAFDLLKKWFGFDTIDNVVGEQVAAYEAAKLGLSQVIFRPDVQDAQMKAALNEFHQKFDVLIRNRKLAV